MKTNYLILGGSGFIGSQIINDSRFDNKLIISRKKINNLNNEKLILKDISSINNDDLVRLENYQPTVVINAAWSGIGAYNLENCLENINAHMVFLEKISKIKSINKYINFGSAWECNVLGGKVNEAATFQNNTEFLLAKKIIYDYANNLFGDKHLWLRLFYVFGNTQEKGLIKYIIKKAIRNEELQVKSLSSVLDYISIDNVVEYVYQFSIKNVSGGIYNIGTGEPKSNLEIIKLIESKLNKKISLLKPETNNIPIQNYWACMNKTKKNLNIQVNCRFDQEIDKIIIHETKKYSYNKNSS